MCLVLLFERTRLVANTFFERHLDLRHTCHKEAADQYQILSASLCEARSQYPVANVMAYKKDLLPATISLSLLATPEALTIKASDEGNHLTFPKPVLLFKHLSRLYGYHFYLNNNTKGVIHG